MKSFMLNLKHDENYFKTMNQSEILPVQTRSLVELQADDWYCPDGHAPEQATETIQVHKPFPMRIS